MPEESTTSGSAAVAPARGTGFVLASVGSLGKLLALSVVLVPLLIARSSARMRDPRRGLRRTVSLTLGFSFLYVLAMIFLFFRLG
jgi:hypothetical protein